MLRFNSQRYSQRFDSLRYSQRPEDYSHITTASERAKKKLLLNEKMASNKRCLLQLFVNCESQRQMHRLAETYYASRDNWFHFIPLTILTLISGI